MDAIIEYYDRLGLDFPALLTVGAILLVGLVLSSLLCRFIFGKQSSVYCAVSSAIAVIFTYCGIIGLYYAGPRFEAFIAPMPFATIDGTQLLLFSFSNAPYTAICTQIVSMIVLTFLVNIIDRWMPKKSNLFAWLFFRLLTVVTSLLVHLIVCALLQKYLPQGIATYAPAILLGLLVLMLLTGALKLLVGILLTSVNPIVAALYTFFFASVVGKMLTRAMLTTGLLAGFVAILGHLGITSVSITGPALVSYLPFFVLLALLWFTIREK